MKRYWLLGGIALILILAACNTNSPAPDPELDLAVAVPTPTYTEEWDGKQRSDPDQCDKKLEVDDPRLGFEGGGWIHWVFSTKGSSTSAKLTLSGSGEGTYDPGPPLNANAWHFYTPYFDLSELSATIELFGGDPGPGGGLVISDYCPGEGVEELTVEKTADTSFTREHFWDITKEVETENEAEHEGYPKIWLYADGSGDETATWTVDVTYEGYEDGDHNVSGEITIENTGTLDAVITAVDDVLAGTPINVDCGVTFPYTLEVGDTLTCTYDEDGYVEGSNEVTVTTERDTYFADAEIIWGHPTTEINKTVNVKDISDLFGEVNLGTAMAPVDAQFTYDKHFAWQDYGRDNCGDFTYDNTATIVETDQSADATLKVNVQCLIFKGETAWAANGHKPGELRYTSRGNWATYVKYQGFAATGKTTTLFAGQTINVGSVNFSAATGGQVVITVSLTGAWEFEDVSENLKVQDYATAPSGNPAPGLFAHKKTCDVESNACEIVVPQNNFYGVHVNVGQWIPDPNFGP